MRSTNIIVLVLVSNVATLGGNRDTAISIVLNFVYGT